MKKLLVLFLLCVGLIFPAMQEVSATAQICPCVKCVVGADGCTVCESGTSGGLQCRPEGCSHCRLWTACGCSPPRPPSEDLVVDEGLASRLKAERPTFDLSFIRQVALYSPRIAATLAVINAQGGLDTKWTQVNWSKVELNEQDIQLLAMPKDQRNDQTEDQIQNLNERSRKANLKHQDLVPVEVNVGLGPDSNFIVQVVERNGGGKDSERRMSAIISQGKVIEVFLGQQDR